MSKVVDENKYKALRKKLGMNQAEFWGKIAVTQSGGSRYENGRRVPGTTANLVELAYGKNPLKALAKLRCTTVDALVAK